MIFTTTVLTDQEMRVIEKIDRIRKTLKYALSEPSRWYGFLRRSSFARAIRGSNSIEGFNVTAEDALAAVDGGEPTDAEQEAWEAVKGYRNAMTYVLQLATDEHFSYSEGLLRSLHYMMLHYDLTKHPGRWRPGPIYVNDEKKKEIVYEGPDAEMVPGLMKELVESLNAQNNHVPVMARAAMSHLNLAMIHPFSDGNGRMARCLQTLALAREGILSPEFCSIEEYLGDDTQAYYDVLAEVGRGAWHPENDVRPWIRFCLTAHFRQASTLLRRSKETKRVWDLLDVEVKRHGLPDRMVGALVNAAFGLRIKNTNYRIAADVSENVASRDLKELVDSGLLIASGEKRGRYYEASTPIRSIRERCREPKENIDPFTHESLRLPGM